MFIFRWHDRTVQGEYYYATDGDGAGSPVFTWGDGNEHGHWDGNGQGFDQVFWYGPDIVFAAPPCI
jgi:hypothetical protein